MSILIKGMDMPSKCYECFLQNECGLVNPYYVESTRPQDCPLVELPSAEPQIIRCKDCKHYNKFIATLLNTGLAVWDEYCERFRRSVTADAFCSWAEEREKE